MQQAKPIETLTDKDGAPLVPGALYCCAENRRDYVRNEDYVSYGILVRYLGVDRYADGTGRHVFADADTLEECHPGYYDFLEPQRAPVLDARYCYA